MVISRAPANLAAVAGPPSPLNPLVPVPAIVVMIPAASTLRMRLLMAMISSPAAFSFTAAGSVTEAAVAGPPSPNVLPPPATVLMIPAVLILRTLFDN